MSVADPVSPPWAAELATARDEQGIPVAELCRRARVSRRHWYLIVAGLRTPSPDVLRRLARHLPTLDPEHLVGLAHPRPTRTP